MDIILELIIITFIAVGLGSFLNFVIGYNTVNTPEVVIVSIIFFIINRAFK